MSQETVSNIKNKNNKSHDSMEPMKGMIVHRKQNRRVMKNKLIATTIIKINDG